MYLMYVDESGDSGIEGSPTQHFAISSLIVHELRWQECLAQLVAFRRRMKDKYGLKMNEEIHAAAMINHPRALARIPRNDRLTIIRAFADEIATLPDVNIINVLLKKKTGDTSESVFDRAWRALIQRFENTLSHRNFPGPANADERGIIFCDATDQRLNRLMRKMRRYNPIPNQPQYGGGYRDLRLKYVLEDPIHRDSTATYFIQAADTIAYLLYQAESPNAYMRKRGGNKYLRRLEPVLCKVASGYDKLGIVRL
jgi:hypothetical protein